MAGYVVVRAVGGQEILDGEGGFICSYGGLDNCAWQDVDDLYYEKMLPVDLMEIREVSVNNRLGNYSPGATNSIGDAVLLLNACRVKEGLRIIRISEIESDDDLTRSHVLDGGVDCYIDGFGSVLALGLHQKPHAFSDFFTYLNPVGLFSDIYVFYEYLKSYRSIMLRENLEPIDNWSNLCLYNVVPMTSS